MSTHDHDPARRRRVFFALQRTAHRLQRYADRRLNAATSLTTQQAAVLSVLDQTGSSHQRAIASQLDLHESAVTPVIRRLTEAGYIQRTRKASDRRAYDLQLTPAGKAALAACRSAFAPVNAQMADALSESEIEVLADLLDRLADAFPGPASQ